MMFFYFLKIIFKINAYQNDPHYQKFAEYQRHYRHNKFVRNLRSQLPTEFFPSVIPPVYTDGHIRSVFVDGMTDGIFRIKKKSGSLTWRFLRVILPTESPRDSKRQLRTLTWPIHRLKCQRNHREIQTGISVQWRALFIVRIADGITNGIILSVNPSVKVNICQLCGPSPPLFLLLLSHPNSPLLQTTSPPKKRSPSSQHNKSYFLKFCGHNIRVLIYRRILSVFVSNSIFLNFNI